MQLLDNISDRQNIAFGNTENGRLCHFQNTDNQYRYSRKSTPNSTGKELDAETGFSYFGARYLDHTLTTAWLSVDPMSDKYPSISPYAYCAWNPMKLVDPNGKEADDEFDWVKRTGTYQYEWMDNVTCKNNTPSGYDYVGQNETSIVSNLGLIGEYAQKESSARGFSAKVSKGLIGASFINKYNNVLVNIYAYAKTSTDKSKVTANNKDGRFFCGIIVSATVIQYSLDMTSGYGGMEYNGGLMVYSRSNSILNAEKISPFKGPEIKAQNSTTYTAQCLITPGQIMKYGKPSLAKIQLGYCDSWTYNVAYDFTWIL